MSRRIETTELTRRRSLWRVTVASRDGTRLLHACNCEDLKEVQGICTEARHHDLRYKIIITPPMGGRSYSWD